jgi:hypothetical protein
MCRIHLAHPLFPHCALAAPAAPEPRVSDCLLKARSTGVHLYRRPGVLRDVSRAVLHGLDAGAEREGRGAARRRRGRRSLGVLIAAAKPRIQVRQRGAAGLKAQRRGVAGSWCW